MEPGVYDASARAIHAAREVCEAFADAEGGESEALAMLRRANKQLSKEIESLRENTSVHKREHRLKELLSDLREKDRVNEVLRAILAERGQSIEDVEAELDRKIFKEDRMLGASRELLQRELRRLRTLQAEGLITTKTSTKGNKIRPAIPPSAASRKEKLDRLLDASAELEGALSETMGGLKPSMSVESVASSKEGHLHKVLRHLEIQEQKMEAAMKQLGKDVRADLEGVLANQRASMEKKRREEGEQGLQARLDQMAAALKEAEVRRKSETEDQFRAREAHVDRLNDEMARVRAQIESSAAAAPPALGEDPAVWEERMDRIAREQREFLERGKRESEGTVLQIAKQSQGHEAALRDKDRLLSTAEKEAERLRHECAALRVEMGKQQEAHRGEINALARKMLAQNIDIRAAAREEAKYQEARARRLEEALTVRVGANEEQAARMDALRVEAEVSRRELARLREFLGEQQAEAREMASRMVRAEADSASMRRALTENVLLREAELTRAQAEMVAALEASAAEYSDHVEAAARALDAREAARGGGEKGKKGMGCAGGSGSSRGAEEEAGTIHEAVAAARMVEEQYRKACEYMQEKLLECRAISEAKERAISDLRAQLRGERARADSLALALEAVGGAGGGGAGGGGAGGGGAEGAPFPEASTPQSSVSSDGPLFDECERVRSMLEGLLPH